MPKSPIHGIAGRVVTIRAQVRVTPLLGQSPLLKRHFLARDKVDRLIRRNSGDDEAPPLGSLSQGPGQ